MHRYAEVMLTLVITTILTLRNATVFQNYGKESHSVHAELKTFILVHSVYFPDCTGLEAIEQTEPAF